MHIEIDSTKLTIFDEDLSEIAIRIVFAIKDSKCFGINKENRLY